MLTGFATVALPYSADVPHSNSISEVELLAFITPLKIALVVKISVASRVLTTGSKGLVVSDKSSP